MQIMQAGLPEFALWAKKRMQAYVGLIKKVHAMIVQVLTVEKAKLEAAMKDIFGKPKLGATAETWQERKRRLATQKAWGLPTLV